MFCDECGQRMQAETVIAVTRLRGRNRAVARPGWYCWSCRVSRPVASMPETLAPAPSGLLSLRRLAGIAMAGRRPH